ncbi:PREDICTED: uncharacterized protein LOC104725288 [Camelina sativa]|uniref:Uncharacterized protein LOC104725288 n=1 Tax=Camelina sativa TaxID=90675 RepID=A0ABM0UJW7_CAMSA|nr:PREDICTED: uncharacterized protein LOC104725288 [Camelina sativa]
MMAETTLAAYEKSFGITQIRAYIFVTLDLNKLNYEVWRELFETHCLSFSVLGHIDGSSSLTPMTEKRWKERDGLVKMWIYGTITDSLLDTIIKVGCTARDLWISLENLFRDNKEARALQFENELRTMTIGDLSVHEYCQKLKSLSDLLTNVDSPISDRVLVMHLLNGLTEKYDYILNVIKHKSPFPSFTEARSMLLMEESRLSKQSKPSLSNTYHPFLPNVLFPVPGPQERYPQEYHNNMISNNHNNYMGYICNGKNNCGSCTSCSQYYNNNNWRFNPNSTWTYSHPQCAYPYPQGGSRFFHNQTYHPQQLPLHMPTTTSHKLAPTSILGANNPYLPGDANVNYVSACMRDQSTFMPSHHSHAYTSMPLSTPTEETWYNGTKDTNNVSS